MTKPKTEVETTPLTEADIHKYKQMAEVILSKGLRDQIFMPFSLELLNYEIVFTDRFPKICGESPAFTDFKRIYINPKGKWFADVLTRQASGYNHYSFSENDLITMLCYHEVSHILLFHHLRMGHRDGEIWNIAGDFVINLLLANLEGEAANKVKKPLINMSIKNIPEKKIMLNDKFSGMIEEEVYDDLTKNKNITKQITYTNINDFMEALNKGTDCKGSPNQSDIQGPHVVITKTTIKIDSKTHTNTTVSFPHLDPSTPEEEEDMKKREHRVQLSRQQLQETLMKGVESAELGAFLGKLFKIKIDWKKILKNSLLTAFEKGFDQEWSLPRTVWLANPRMPYLPNIQEEERYGVAFLSIDESGSMNDDDVIAAIDIVRQAKDKYKALFIIKHDSNRTKTYYFDEDLTDADIKMLATRQFCGGTSHVEVFARINEFLKTHRDEMASVYIGITDMCSDLESCQRDLPLSIPRVYIVN